MSDLTEKLEKIIDKNRILENEPMSKHTSFRIGGNADYYLKIQTEAELKNVLKLSSDEKIPVQIVGNGTNLLVKDGGIRGFVIKLDFTEIQINQEENDYYLSVGAGVTLAKLALISLENSLAGLEEISGIPGTIGGAIRMNAGAYGKEMKDVVVKTKCMNQNGDIIELNLKEHEFGYRSSTFAKNNLIILQTVIKLQKGNQEEIREKMKKCKDSRKNNQPLEFPNAGSTFKRNEEFPTSKMIDECGLKGYRIGDAEISNKHAGFLVNKGNATAKDVLELTEYVTKEVKKKFDKDINLEIIVIGEE